MTFPKTFCGAATLAYQAEGAVDEDGRGLSICDTFSHAPGNVVHGDSGDVACNHCHRLEEYLDLMVSLGIIAYRISGVWPRIQPVGSGPRTGRASTSTSGSWTG